MALKSNFYDEIFTNEKRWIELINQNLLNSIYCNLVLKPFYEAKKKELEQEYKLTGNKIIEQMIIAINNIITQINIFESQYKSSQNVKMQFILPLFLTNQMNNTNNMENRMIDNRENLNNGILNSENDYMYDDFPDEIKKIK